MAEITNPHDRFSKELLSQPLASFIDTWIQQGFEKGMQQGLQQGLRQGLQQDLQQGLASMILKQLQHLLGDLPQTAQERIRNLSAEKLEELGEALLNFKTMADLENWLRQDQPVN